jgi:hypothetical protein
MKGKKILYILAVIFGTILLYNLINTLSPSTFSDSSSPNDQLSADVKAGPEGLYVTNNESSTWTDCMVGLNGQDGWGFDNPPYQTRNLISLSPGDQTLIPFTKITTTDGTSFDLTTHTVNSVVIECFRGTPNLRDWIGQSK